MSGCIQVELHPGVDNNLDKKTFKWELIEFDERTIKIKLDFDHPEYISMVEYDKI